MRDLTGTDVRWLAKGYWDNHFNWRMHPKVKLPAIIAAATLGLLVILAVATGDVSPTPWALRSLLLVVLLVFAGAVCWGLIALFKERDAFMDSVQQAWEATGEIPDRSTVTIFVESKGLRVRES